MAISEADYLRLDALAARGSASARAAFLRAMRRGLDSADTRKLRLAIQHGDGSLAVDAVNWLELEVDLSRMFIGNDGGLADGVGPLAQAASRLAGSALGPLADTFGGGEADALTQRAMTGVGEHAGSRVRRISDESRRGLRALVEAGFDEDRDFGEVEADMAALLRADGGFGLDERSAGAIAKRELAMKKAGVLKRDRDRIVRKLKVEALQRRARLVATTELQDIGNEAMLATWREAERESGATIWKVWRTRGDEACPRCQALDFQRRRLDDRFSGTGGDAPMRPLLHPHCYCWLDMVMVEGEEYTPGGASRSAAPRPVDPMARAAASPVRAEQRAAQSRARRRVARVRQERSDRMRAINAAQRPAPPPTATTRQRAQRAAPPRPSQNSPEVAAAERAVRAAVEASREQEVADVVYRGREQDPAEHGKRVGQAAKAFTEKHGHIRELELQSYTISDTAEFIEKHHGGDAPSGAMWKALGYDKKPQLVDELEMDELVRKRGWQEVFRGVATDEQVEMFKAGPLFPGRGIYGNGTYTAMDYDTALGYTDMDNPETVMRLALKPDAKIAAFSDADGAATNLQAGMPSWGDSEDEGFSRPMLERLSRDPSLLAGLSGYDAVRVSWGGESDRDYFVILNRGAVAVQRTKAKKPGGKR